MTVMFIFGACILCTILPSQVAFTSLISAGGIPTTAAYGLIALLRLTMTPNDFKTSHFYLGRWRKPFYLAAVLFNGLIFAVSFFSCSLKSCLTDCGSQTQVSPFYFPVTAETFNFACVILGAVTIFGILSYYIVPDDKWLRKSLVEQTLRAADEPIPTTSTGLRHRESTATDGIDVKE